MLETLSHQPERSTLGMEPLGLGLQGLWGREVLSIFDAHALTGTCLNGGLDLTFAYANLQNGTTILSPLALKSKV